MKMYLKLNEVYDEGLSGNGIFNDLQSLDVPWKDESISSTLDLAYHGDHGERLISPLLKKMLNSDDELIDANRAKIANVIYNLFIPKWTHEYNLLKAEYNPISNYDMVETETPAEVTRTITPAETTTTNTPSETTETITPAETSIDTLPAKITTENEVSAFNSSDYVESDKSTVSGDSTEKGSERLTVDASGSNKFEVDTAGTNKFEVDTAGSEVLTVQNERTLTRSGNIGVTTTQQMMQQEIELWKWIFYRSVFNDIDSVLTLKIYY